MVDLFHDVKTDDTNAELLSAVQLVATRPYATSRSYLRLMNRSQRVQLKPG